MVERLEALTVEITARNQKGVNRLGFWLFTSVGVNDYHALIISRLLRWKLKV